MSNQLQPLLSVELHLCRRSELSKRDEREVDEKDDKDMSDNMVHEMVQGEDEMLKKEMSATIPAASSFPD